MTDDILARIDAAVGCHTCGGVLADDSPSGDFCSASCQADWHVALGEPLVGYREPWDEHLYFAGGSEMAVYRTFRLPRQTGDLRADLHALRRAQLAAATPAQVAACEVRAGQLRARQIEEYARLVESLRPAFASMARTIGDIGRQLSEAMRPTVAAFAELGRIAGVEKAAQADRGAVMERALAAKRGRNTGPVQHRRAPRRIDATRAR